MKQNTILLITSLLTILFTTFHLADDIVRGMSPGGLTNYTAVFVWVVWLYGTLMLNDRRSGHIIMLIGSILAMGMPVVHVMGPNGIFSREFSKYSGAFLFFWTFFVLGITGMLSFILSVRGLWSLRRGQPGLSK